MEKTINQLEEQRTLLEHVAAGVAALDPEYKDYPAPMHLFYKMRTMLKDKSAPGYMAELNTQRFRPISQRL